MTLTEYLNKILRTQTLADDSEEMQNLRAEREKVEEILRKRFSGSDMTIRYGGSKAKGTIIRDAYDLDIVCYFAHDDDTAGKTLETIYNNVHDALDEHYTIQRKRSALRLRGRNKENKERDFHIDVVPGRFVDSEKEDCYLHQDGGDKSRIKTNLDKHISHVRDSDFTPIIRLMKLWNIRNAVGAKTFILELIVIHLLKGHENDNIGVQFIRVLSELRDNASSINVEDPANPSGNDLSELLDDRVRRAMSDVAAATLAHLEAGQFHAVFGDVSEESDKSAALAAIASSIGTAGTRPWGLS